MVLLTTTPKIFSAISSLPESTVSTLPSCDTPLPTSPGAPISHTTIIALSRLLKQTNTNPPCKDTLNTLLRSAHPYHPPPVPPPARSPEYLALMARLRADQEAREYRLLTSNHTQHPTQIGTNADAPSKEEPDDISPSLVFNILVSIVCVGFASWYMTRWWNNDGIRVLVSLLVAVVVGVAEVTVYAGYLRKVKMSREKERRLRERKVVVSSETVGAREEVTETKDTEEIWGRGKHGGIRRRVREKWEKEQEGNNYE